MTLSKTLRMEPRAGRTLNLQRRRVILTCLAAVCGIATLPFLPRGSDLNPDDLLKPELAQANPALMRELCLEFYAHPKALYRMAAAVLMAEFKDTEVQGVLAARVAAEQVPDIKQRAVKSLIQHQDPQTYPTIAALYWAHPSIRSQVDGRVQLFELTALQAAIQRAQP